MPIPKQEDVRGAGLRVVNKERIGEVFVGAYVKDERRPRKKQNGDPIINEKTGKQRYELIVTCVTMPGTNCSASLGKVAGPAEPGDVVRLILHGGAYAAFIEGQDALPADGRADAARAGQLQVGDVITHAVEYAQSWAGEGSPPSSKMTDQAEIDRLRYKGTTIGLYGPLTLRRINLADEHQWETKAEAAFHELKPAPPVADLQPAGGGYRDEEPF